MVQKMKLGTSNLEVPLIAVGCMRIDAMEQSALTSHLAFCLENGLNFFDHADIYSGGICEEHFAKAFLQTGFQREDILLQSKCGICPNVMYDSSKEHILQAVDGSLKRLQTDYLDVLVIHRPDALMEPEEIAEAFDLLEQSGKVKYFGVSNHRSGQIALLKKYVKQPLIVNQLQFSIPFSSMISAGMETNMCTDGAIDRDGGILDYCRLHDITIQAWSPFQYGFFEGVFIGNEKKYPELNRVLEELSAKYHVTPTALATAWILRHPAHIQMIAGTTNTDRMQELIDGADIQLERQDWYRLYLAAGHILP